MESRRSIGYADTAPWNGAGVPQVGRYDSGMTVDQDTPSRCVRRRPPSAGVAGTS
jgi:hypothetical protein